MLIGFIVNLNLNDFITNICTQQLMALQTPKDKSL